MQLDESTDVTNCGQTAVRFTENDIIKTELLMSKEVSGTTKGKDIFNIVDEFLKKNDLEWSKLVGCTTEAAPAMLGRKSGFQSYVKAVSPEIILLTVSFTDLHFVSRCYLLNYFHAYSKSSRLLIL